MTVNLKQTKPLDPEACSQKDVLAMIDEIDRLRENKGDLVAALEMATRVYDEVSTHSELVAWRGQAQTALDKAKA